MPSAAEPARPPAAGRRLGPAQPVPLRRLDAIVTVVVGASSSAYVAVPAAAVRVRHRALGDRAGQPQAAHGRPLPRRRAVADRRRGRRRSRCCGGLVAGLVAARQRRAGTTSTRAPQPWWRRVLRPRSAGSGRCSSASPCCSLLSTTAPGRGSPSARSSSPPSSVASSAGSLGRAAGSVGRRVVLVARRSPRSRRRCTVYLVDAARLGRVGRVHAQPVPRRLLASSLCFPLGVLLALGRRSKLPLIRWLSHRLHRAVPRRRRCSCCCCSPNIALGFFVPADARARRRRRGRSSCSRCSPRPTSPRSSAAGCSRCRAGQTRRPRRSGCRRCARRS